MKASGKGGGQSEAGLASQSRRDGAARRGRRDELRAAMLRERDRMARNIHDPLAQGKCRVGPARIRVLVADDHGVVREGLTSIISRQADMMVVAAARNGREAAALWQQHRPDVGLLDLRMPELDGVAALEEIRREEPSARVIFLSTYDTDEDVYQGLRAGAKAYMLKDARRADLLDCIRRVHAGQTIVPGSIAAKLAQHVGAEELTAREVQVLRLMASGRSNKEIGVCLFISETTVKSHVKGIFGKLNVLSRTEAITTATRRGLIRL